MASGLGMMFFLFFGVTSLGFWYGAKLVNTGEMSAGDVCVILI